MQFNAENIKYKNSYGIVKTLSLQYLYLIY